MRYNSSILWFYFTRMEEPLVFYKAETGGILCGEITSLWPEMVKYFPAAWYWWNSCIRKVRQTCRWMHVNSVIITHTWDWRLSIDWSVWGRGFDVIWVKVVGLCVHVIHHSKICKSIDKTSIKLVLQCALINKYSTLIVMQILHDTLSLVQSDRTKVHGRHVRCH